MIHNSGAGAFEEMNEDKEELITLIQEINNPKMMRYILGFVKAFVNIRK